MLRTFKVASHKVRVIAGLTYLRQFFKYSCFEPDGCDDVNLHRTIVCCASTTTDTGGDVAIHSYASGWGLALQFRGGTKGGPNKS